MRLISWIHPRGSEQCQLPMAMFMSMSVFVFMFMFIFLFVLMHHRLEHEHEQDNEHRHEMDFDVAMNTDIYYTDMDTGMDVDLNSGMSYRIIGYLIKNSNYGIIVVG